MSCNCTKVKNLPTCIEVLEVGTIGLVSQDVYVYLRNTSLEYNIRITGTADVDGLVTVDFSSLDSNFFSENYTYEIWVTEIGASPSDKQDITIGSTTDNCLMVNFERIQDNSLESVYYTTVIAEIA